MKILRRIFCASCHAIPVLMAILLTTTMALADPSATPRQPASDNPPIRVTAKRMVSQEAENSVVFMGKVHAVQGETVINCEEMTVFYKQEQAKKEGTEQIEKLICIDDVEVTSGNWLGTSNRMEYYDKAKKIILIGDAKAWKGNNMVQGEKIIHFLESGRSEVEQPTGDKEGGGQVEMIIQPGA